MFSNYIIGHNAERLWITKLVFTDVIYVNLEITDNAIYVC